MKARVGTALQTTGGGLATPLPSTPATPTPTQNNTITGEKASTLPTGNPDNPNELIPQLRLTTISTYPRVNVSIQGQGMTRKEINDAIKKTGLPPNIAGNIKIDKRGDTIYTDFVGNGIQMRRNIDSDKVYNAWFYISRGSPYKGRSLEIFNNQVQELTRLRYKELTVTAGKSITMNGYNTWLRFGYTPDRYDIQRMTDSYFRQTGVRVNDHIELMATQAGRDWWRNGGFQWSGTFDLKPNSINHRQLKNYIKEKGNRP